MSMIVFVVIIITVTAIIIDNITHMILIVVVHCQVTLLERYRCADMFQDTAYNDAYGTIVSERVARWYVHLLAPGHLLLLLSLPLISVSANATFVFVCCDWLP